MGWVNELPSTNSIKHHGLVPVKQHPVLQVPAHRLGEHLSLEIAPHPHQVVDIVPVTAMP